MEVRLLSDLLLIDFPIALFCVTRRVISAPEYIIESHGFKIGQLSRGAGPFSVRAHSLMQCDSSASKGRFQIRKLR